MCFSWSPVEFGLALAKNLLLPLQNAVKLLKTIETFGSGITLVTLIEEMMILWKYLNWRL